MNATQTQETETTTSEKTLGAYLTGHLREYGLLLALVAIIIFFQVATGGVLLKSGSVKNLILQNGYIIIMALGMLLVIIAGHIDLSVGSVMGFVGAFAAVMIVQWEQSVLLTFFACLVLGTAIGAVQGYFVAYWRIPSFIVTLAGMLFFSGAMLWLLNGASVGPFPKEFQILSTGFVPDIFSKETMSVFAEMFGARRFNGLSMIAGIIAAVIVVMMGLRGRAQEAKYGMESEPTALFWGKTLVIAGAIMFVMFKLATFRGIPNVLVSMAILTIIYAFITSSTTIGRRVYALGGNEKAAKLSGIKTERLTFLAFANNGMLAGFAGMLLAARLNSATPKAGLAVELDVIAAVFIGGASMSGGSGKVLGVVVGAFIMGVMNMGMSIMSLGIDYQKMIKAVVLLAAVFFDVYNRQKQS